MRQSKSLKRDNVQNPVEPEMGNETHGAMLNDVVLENTFKYLGYKDLKSCRHVGNTIWLRNSKKAWWTQAKVVFRGRTGVAEKIKEFLSQNEMASNAINYKFGDYDETLEGDFKWFWDSVGNSLKYLEIEFGRFQSVDSFRQLVYIQCPNLETLLIRSYHFTTHEAAYEPMKWESPRFGEQKNLRFLKTDFIRLPVSWMELLSHFPNLQDIKVTEQTVDIYKVISIIRQHDPKMLKLRTINLNMFLKQGIDHSVRSVLLDSNLSFRKLGICLKNCEPQSVADILDFHAKSLNELVIQDDRESQRHSPKLLRQPLNNLEKLTLRTHKFPLEIFKCTPNVKKIVLVNANLQKLLSTYQNIRLNSCTELVLKNDETGDKPSPELVFFCSACPNVEKLQIKNLNNLNFSMICEGFSKLVSIYVEYGSSVDVVGLLGFDPNSKTKDGIRRPNITNLKDLQSFSMSSKSFFGHSEGLEMKNAGIIRKELNKLHHLKTFKLIGYQFSRSPVWKGLFAKYGN